MRAIRNFLLSLVLLTSWTSSFAITHGELFTWAAATYPAYFPGTPQADQILQYDYRYYSSGNYLAVGDDDGVYVLGPISGNQIARVGALADFAPAVLAWEATQPVSAYKSKVLIRAWNPNGSEASIQDFVNFTHYVMNRWNHYANFGIFPMGKAPATAQIGSQISPTNIDGINYIVMEVPKNDRFYFTALWKAPVIGTVFMRADAEGSGYVITGDQPLKLNLPYDFAVSEYQQALRLPGAASPTPATQLMLTQAAAAIEAARNAPAGSAKALASYTALSSAMPLKEHLVLDASAAWLAANGRRSDFELNYEGFGSWTVPQYAASFNSAKDAGFTSVYTTVPWGIISPAPGVYDFSLLDYQISDAEAKGFKIGMNINTSYKDALPGWAQGLDFEALKALYFENARQVVARYGSRISVYYPAGEFEFGAAHGVTIAQAAEFVRQSLNGARAAAPGMQFGYYSSASSFVSYQMNVVQTPTFSGLDLIAYMVRNNIHNDFIGLEMQYGTTFAPIDLQRFQEVLQDTYKIAQVPIYLGETGYSSMTEDYGIPASFYWHDGLTRQSQYEWADGTLRILYAMPFVKAYYWVHLDADNDDRGSDYLSGLVGTSFVNANTGAIKKVQSAFKNFTTQVNGMAASRTAGQ